MNKQEYYRIRDEVYKNAGNDKFDFDLMLTRVVTKAVEAEREACAKVCEVLDDGSYAGGDQPYGQHYAAAIRARGQE
jgi:hypothetical protein